MATYANGEWSNLNLATNQRRTGNNPFTKADYISDFPDKEAGEWEQYWPVSNGGGNFITNDGGYASWSNGSSPDGQGWPQWTLKTDPNEQMFVDRFPGDRETKVKIYVSYDNRSDPPRYTGGHGRSKDEAKTDPNTGEFYGGLSGPQIKVVQIEIDPNTQDLNKWLKDQVDPSGNEIKGAGSSGASDALKDYREEMRTNENDNTQDVTNRYTAMAEWNQANVYEPANAYAEQHNQTGSQWRQDSANSYNAALDADDGPRQTLANQTNAQGDVEYNYAVGLNNWSKQATDWAKGSQTGVYTDNRAHIFSGNGLAGSLGSFAESINNQAIDAGLDPLITNDTYNQMLQGMKQSYGAYYTNDRIQGWNGQTDGGTYDLIGQFDKDYYLNEYGNSRGINHKWAVATQYGDASNPYDPNNDLDVTARFGSIDNLAWYDYSNGGKTDGARGSAASDTTTSDNYNESWDSKTDAEKGTIRDQMFGLTGEGNTIE